MIFSLEKLKVPQTTQAGRWINHDIRPVETPRRTWNFWVFNNLWLLSYFNIANYLSGSALIPLGLTKWQAIVCVIIGNILSALFCFLNSLPGAYYSVGFPVANRAVWGMWGSQFVVWNRIFLSLVWYGFNAWVGGTCMYAVFTALDVDIETHIPNTMPADTAMTTAQFVAYVIFSIISLPVAYIHPHKLTWFFRCASAVCIVFFTALLIWALATMGPDGLGDTGGGDSPSISSDPKSSRSIGWLMVFGIISTIGGGAAGILNQNDYSRFATQPWHALSTAAFLLPLYAVGCAGLGLLVTAATQHRFGGEAVWNPPTLLVRLIADDPAPGTRAAVFFAALALVVSQIGLNVPSNALAGGFDLAATFPRYVNIRRGSFITIALSVVVNPWRLVGTSTVFLVVMSSFSVFMAPMTGMMVSSFLLVGRGKLNTDDLFRGDKNSIYWFTAGFNWRAPIAWIVGFLPVMPGLVAAVNPSILVPDNMTKIYNLSYLYGFFSSAILFALLHKIFPARHLDAFVNSDATPKELRTESRWKWDGLRYEPGIIEAEGIKDEDASRKLDTVVKIVTS